MAYSNVSQTIPGASITAEADEDLEAGDLVKFATDGKVDRSATAGELVHGIALSDANDGDVVAVGFPIGVYECVASAAITRGANVASTGTNTDANKGRVKTAASGNNILGIALNAASAAGDFVSVYFIPGLGTVS